MSLARESSKGIPPLGATSTASTPVSAHPIGLPTSAARRSQRQLPDDPARPARCQATVRDGGDLSFPLSNNPRTGGYARPKAGANPPDGA
jgi:hypothetical protein